MSASALIVDDSLTVRMDLADAFEAAGIKAIPCGSAREAREALAREAVGIVILDVRLPDGDGVELLHEIRRDARTQALPILMLSSEAEVRDRIRGLQTGADDYVGKPYDSGYVVARARDLLRRTRSGPSSPSDAKRPSILLVDDSTTYRETLHDALEAANYNVITARSGEEGLRIAETTRPTAILVDSLMPGMDGATFVRKIRLDAALRGTPCILLTASEDKGAELRALDAGADAFVRKEEEVDVILARLAAALRAAQTERVAGQGLAGPRRVLAVDDSVTYLQELAAILREDGYDVVLAKSGEEAIELLSVQAVDCILLDLLMPGIGGKETCHRIKGSPGLRDIPLIMLTALEDRAALIEGLSTGADDYISKSSEIDILRARVRAQIRRKQFEDENRKIREDILRKELEAAGARAAHALAEARLALTEELERKNKDLESFSYSVSHDLRAPLRSIDGFSQLLLEEYGSVLDETGQDYLRRVRGATQRMGELIDDLLELSRVARADIVQDRVDLSELARSVADELAEREPSRKVVFTIAPGVAARVDRRLIRVLFENLLGNAWKFTSKTEHAEVSFGVTEHAGAPAYFVRDNGAGFEPSVAEKLFRPFQRLHTEAEFPGTGIGLATVHRIVDRHGGRVWAEGTPGRGATIFFTFRA